MRYMIISILLMILISGCTQNLKISYNINGCDSELTEDRIELAGNEDMIEWEQVLYTYCESEEDIEIKLKKEGNNLIISEIFDPKDDVAMCTCPMEITGSIENLNDGTYSLTYIFENKFVNQEQIIKKYTFTVTKENQPIVFQEEPIEKIS